MCETSHLLGLLECLLFLASWILAAFRIRDIRSLSQLRIGLGEKVLGALCVPAKLSIVGSLGVLDLLVGADYKRRCL